MGQRVPFLPNIPHSVHDPKSFDTISNHPRSQTVDTVYRAVDHRVRLGCRNLRKLFEECLHCPCRLKSNNHLARYGADTQEGMGHSPRTKDARACNGAELLVADLKDKL